MKLPVEKFNAFLERTEPDQYGWTIQKVVENAERLGHTREEVRVACREIRTWLVINENNKKATRVKHWARFILNWLKPKPIRKSRRVEPSNFQGESRIEE